VSTNGVFIGADTFTIFKNAVADYNVPDSTYGIELINSVPYQINAPYGSFKNVNKAIDISFPDSTDTGISIKYNDIEYSQTGIRIKNGLGDIIRYNTIYDKPLYYDTASINGVITDSTQQIYIRDNNIKNLEYGITVNNCDSIYNSRIWNNIVQSCTGYGIGTGGKNSNATLDTGLTVYCNNISNCDTGWSAYNFIDSLRLPRQGNCAAGGNPPANYFTNYSNPDISNPTGFTIIYYVDTTAGSNPGFKPDAASTGISGPCGSFAPTDTANQHCLGFEFEARFAENKNKHDSSNNINSWLGNIYPNPFNDFTNATYFIPVNSSSAEIVIFDMMGNKMDAYPLYIKGVQSVLKISSKNYSSGVYSCILIVDRSKIEWKKLIIIK
jgi:hypothetical protein